MREDPKFIEINRINLNQMAKLTECAFYEPQPGDRIRILVHYNDSWRPLLWFQVGKDGSIYISPRVTKVSTLKKGTLTSQDGKVRVNYADGEEIKDSNLKGNTKTSFHSSGKINSPGSHGLNGISLRELKNQEQICLMTLQHPNSFKSVPKVLNKKGKRDVCLKYPVDEERPLNLSLFVSPKEKFQPITRSDSVAHQLNLVFMYSNLDGVGDMFLQLIMNHGPSGPWPPYNYILFGFN